MITSWQSSDGTEARIQAKGNFSLGAGGLINVLAALAAVTLCLAGVLAWQGYWPILLIAIIQVILVSWILIRAWERSWLLEVIEIGPETITVTHQRHRIKRRVELESAWARVEWVEPAIAWYAPRVVLKSKTTELELGAFLTGVEKRELADQLKRAIANYSVL